MTAMSIAINHLSIKHTTLPTLQAFFHDMIAALSCAVLVTPESLSYMVLATLSKYSAVC